jgi:putative SOS response-associated peptidase YedK
MCGRYFFSHPDDIFKRYDIAEEEYKKFEPNFNVSPGEKSPIILSDSKGRHVRMVKWGMIPFWAKDPKIGFRMINARMETLREKPSWRKSFISQRALVPASGFYEWRKEGSEKHPYVVKPKGKNLVSFAGLYDIWKGPDDKLIPTFTIITAPADQTVDPIHDRMPVILTPDGEEVWIDYEIKDPELLEDVLRNQGEHNLEAYPVSDKVNRTSENDASLVEPV